MADRNFHYKPRAPFASITMAGHQTSGECSTVGRFRDSYRIANETSGRSYTDSFVLCCKDV